MQMKLTQTSDHFTVFKSFPSTSCCSQKLPPNNLAGWTYEVVSARVVNTLPILYYELLVSGMFSLGGGWTCRKRLVQNCGKVLVKPKNQPGGVVLAP